MARKIKIGIAGVGHMGRRHVEKLRTLQKLRPISLIGFFDANPIQTERVAQEKRLLAYESFSKLLFDVDALVVAASTASHFRLAREAIEAGVHVLVEKPITDDEEEAKKLVELSRSQGVILQVGFLERFRYLKLLECITWSQPSQVRFKRHNLSPGRDPDIDVVLDLMIHDLDITIAITGEEPKAVWAQGSKSVSDTWDEVKAHLEFEKGLTVQLSASRVAPQMERQVELSWEHGVARLDFLQNSVSFSNGPFDETGKTIRCKDFDALLEQSLHFVDCVIEKKAPLISGEDSLLSLRMVQSIQRQLTLGVPLPTELLQIGPNLNEI